MRSRRRCPPCKSRHATWSLRSEWTVPPQRWRRCWTVALMRCQRAATPRAGHSRCFPRRLARPWTWRSSGCASRWTTAPSSSSRRLRGRCRSACSRPLCLSAWTTPTSRRQSLRTCARCAISSPTPMSQPASPKRQSPASSRGTPATPAPRTTSRRAHPRCRSRCCATSDRGRRATRIIRRRSPRISSAASCSPARRRTAAVAAGPRCSNSWGTGAPP
mmetsp:Transcript_81793/g.226605  ORF Transcript_81793/g.226605 Transcript_81793/m.226605 type:complete len:218 (-) Transcript_81793:293-946(-)